MVKYIHFLILMLFFQNLLSAQDTAVKYLDKDLKITSSFENAAFVANITKAENGYFARIFYGRENIALEGYYKDKNLQIKNGNFTFYYASTSRVMSMGSFEYNVPTGLWQRWYENGKKQDSGKKYYGKEVANWKYWHRNGALMAYGKYADSIFTPENLWRGGSRERKVNAVADYIASYYGDIRMGLWKTYFDNNQLKDSVNYNEGLREGFAASWYKNGNKECYGLYRNDKEENTWNWYHPNGKPATIELYKKGTIQSMQCYDTTGTLTGDYCSINKPAIFKGGINALENYVKSNLQYPAEAKKNQYEATVQVSFTITTNGLPDKITITNSPTTYFNKEIERVLYAMPAWEPAIYHNRAVDYLYNMKVEFNLPAE